MPVRAKIDTLRTQRHNRFFSEVRGGREMKAVIPTVALSNQRSGDEYSRSDSEFLYKRRQNVLKMSIAIIESQRNLIDFCRIVGLK